MRYIFSPLKIWVDKKSKPKFCFHICVESYDYCSRSHGLHILIRIACIWKFHFQIKPLGELQKIK